MLLINLGLLMTGCGDKAADSAADTAPAGDDTGAAQAQCAVVGEDMSSAFLSIWGSAADDVYMVGGDVGSGPAFAHFDGAAWTLLDTGSSGNLWWVNSPADDLLVLVGDGGRALTYTPSSGAFTETVLPGGEDFTIFGTWGTSASDIWAVGSNILVSPGNAGAGGVWHFDGTDWAAMTIPDEASEQLVYKVWGTGPDDVWFVGTTGLSMRWDGAGFTVVDTNSTRNLFTISGRGDEVWAVGGYGDGTLLHYSGSWADETPDYSPQLNGVFAASDAVVSCGRMGSVYVNDGSGWVTDDCNQSSFLDFHACWVDDEGGIWAAGGSISSTPLDQGVVVYHGDRELPAISF
jgi:hypothetical protein